MIELLGWLGSALIVASLTRTRPVTFRLLNLASAIVLLVFNLAIGLWSMVVLNVTILVVNGWQLRLLARTGDGRRRHHEALPTRTIDHPDHSSSIARADQRSRQRVSAVR
jgi:hypothetical protein